MPSHVWRIHAGERHQHKRQLIANKHVFTLGVACRVWRRGRERGERVRESAVNRQPQSNPLMMGRDTKNSATNLSTTQQKTATTTTTATITTQYNTYNHNHNHNPTQHPTRYSHNHNHNTPQTHALSGCVCSTSGSQVSSPNRSGDTLFDSM